MVWGHTLDIGGILMPNILFSINPRLDLWRCGRCAALVEVEDRETHAEWHAYSEMSPTMQALSTALNQEV